MFRIVFAEIFYHKILILLLLFFIPIYIMVQYFLSDLGSYLIIFIIFIILQNWIIFRNKEKRDAQITCLPLNNYKIAATRIVTVFCISIMSGVYYYILQLIFMIYKYNNYPITLLKLIKYLSILWVVFSIYFILKDSFFQSIKENKYFKVDKELIRNILMLLVFITVLAQIYFLFDPTRIGRVFDILFWYNPLFFDQNAIYLMIFSLMLSSLTIITYKKRKSYLE